MERLEEVSNESRNDPKSFERNVDYVPHRSLCLGLTFRAWCSVITILILSISLITVTAAYFRNPGGWGPWEDKGSCSKPCGGGYKTQTRECYLNVYYSCQGDKERNITCNTWDCPDCRCGLKEIKTSKIVNGETADKGEYPWQVALYKYGLDIWNKVVEDELDIRPYVQCGGTLINDQWVLTAAHCTDNEAFDEPTEIGVLLGAHKLDDDEEIVMGDLTFRTVTTIVQHPDYDDQMTNYDFSLLKLDRPIDFTSTPNVRPICLPEKMDSSTEYSDYYNVSAIVTGWGSTIKRGKYDPPLGATSKVLRESKDLIVMKNTVCQTKYQNDKVKITEQMLCASSELSQDSCQGDSGGPLITKKNNSKSYELIGVVSWGIGCGLPAYPDVYARVTDVMDWIQLTTKTTNKASKQNCPKQH